MSNADQIQEVELSIEQARGAVSTMTALDTLRKNKDFKNLIETQYFEKEASRLVLLRADPNMQDSESQVEINNQITAIGYLRQYFTTIYQLGRMAEKAVHDDEATLEELNKAELAV